MNESLFYLIISHYNLIGDIVFSNTIQGLDFDSSV